MVQRDGEVETEEAVKIAEISDALGAEVLGVDLRQHLTPLQVIELRDTFRRRKLLLFRQQQLTGEQQVAVARLFGPVASEKAGAYGFVSNVRPDALVPEGPLPYHSDFAFTEEPVHALSLHALEMPRSGAPTQFANATRALDYLPTELRGRIEEVRIVNVYDFKMPTDRRMRERDISAGSPRVERPFVGVHPVTGERVLNANEMHTDRIVGLPEDESEAVLAAVYHVLYGRANVYEHRWKTGDVVLWDNIALHHGRPELPANEPRTLQRVCIHHKTAHELVPNLNELLA